MAKKVSRKEIKSYKLAAIITIMVIILVVGSGWYFIKNHQESSKEVLAIVNGEPVYKQDVEENSKVFFFITGYPEEYQQLITEEMLLNQSISQKLLLQEAKKQGIDVSEQEIRDELEMSLKDGPLTKEDLLVKLEEEGLTLDEIIKYSREQAVIMEFMNESIFPLIKVEDKEVLAYYNRNQDLFKVPEQAKASQILVSSEEEGKEILERLKNGEGFSKLAKENSIDPSVKLNGGDLGYFGRGQMVKEFEDAAFELNVGEISEIIKTDYGYHIIRLTDKKKEELMQLTEVKDEIEQKLLLEKQRDAVQATLEILWQENEIKIK